MGLMDGKRGLVVGIANERSYAYSIAESLLREGAECLFTHLPGDKMERRVRRSLDSLGVKDPWLRSMNAGDDEDMDGCFDAIASEFGSIDFLVHSIAFAWQRNVSELCGEEALTAIDSNLAKLAAKGVTVLAASGDSGAGFEMGVPQCDAGGGLPESAQQGVQVEGTVAKAEVGTDLRSCCEVVQPGFPPTAAWTWEAPRPAPAPAPAPAAAQRRLQTSPGWPHLIGDYDFRNQSFYDGNGAFHHDVYILSGVVSNTSGKVNVHCLNGTIPDTPMIVGEWVKFDSDQWFRKVSVKLPKLTIRGQIMFSEVK